MLPELPYAAWEPTKTTLHLWSQVAGKIKLQYAPFRNHWWNVTLHPSARGLTTQAIPLGDGAFFEMFFDFVDHRFVVESSRAHAPAGFALHDGLSVAEFYARVAQTLGGFGIDVAIRARPYGVPVTTPFAQDSEHRSYDATAARRYWEVLCWSAQAMERFAVPFAGKQSVPQLFWHSFDLALARFSGRRNPQLKGNIVEREAYSHEVIAFGFWPGDANVPAPTYYTYTAPEPAALIERPLEPTGAAWVASGSGHLGCIGYDAIRGAPDPAAALEAFFESGYRAGAAAAGWDTDSLTLRELPE